MAIVSANEIWNSRKGEIDDKGVRKYTRTYRVVSDSLTETPNTVQAATAIGLYAAYPTDPGAINKAQSAKQDSENPYVWEVTLEYDSAPFAASDTSGSPSSSKDNQQTPELRPWTFKFASVKGTKLLVKDLDDVAVASSASQPFDPPIEVPAAFPTIQITAFKSSFDFQQVEYFQDAVNSATWQGFAAKTLRVTEYAASSIYDNGQFIWQIDVTLELRREGWNPVKVLDAGTVEWFNNGVVQGLRQITDAYGQPVNAPVPLDGAGAALPPSGTLVYKEFKGYREVSFATLL